MVESLLLAVTREEVRDAAAEVLRREGLSAAFVGSLPRAEERRLARALDRF